MSISESHLDGYLSKRDLDRQAPKIQAPFGVTNVPVFIFTGLKSLSESKLMSPAVVELIFPFSVLSFSRLFNSEIEHAAPTTVSALSDEHAKAGIVQNAQHKISNILKIFSITLFLISFILTIMIRLFVP